MVLKSDLILGMFFMRQISEERNRAGCLRVQTYKGGKNETPKLLREVQPFGESASHLEKICL